MRRPTNLLGMRFGKLVVSSRAEKPAHLKNSYVYWLCQCDCGNTKVISGQSLWVGDTTSCGCFHKEQTGKINRLPYGESLLNKVYAEYRYGASIRNLEFSLSVSDFRFIILGNCYYCGKPPSRKVTSRGFIGEIYCNGVDRKVNSIGYVLDNCVTCCTECNYLKGWRDHDEFILVIKSIYENIYGIQNELPEMWRE